MTDRYFKWIRLENAICRVFQDFIEEKKPELKTNFQLRKNKQASVDFLWETYYKESWKTKDKYAVEVRSLESSFFEIKNKWWFINLPIAKLNELMMFWRMKKKCYIVYSLAWEVYYLQWDYYLKHNFEIKKEFIWKVSTKGVKYKKEEYILKLPIQNFKYCWKLK